MTRRQLLYIILSFIITTLLLLIVAAVLVISQKKDVQIVWAEVEEKKVETKRQKGRWEEREREAIALVRKLRVTDPEADKKKRKRGEEPEQVALGDLAAREYFEKNYGMQSLEPIGWRARYLKDSYYCVSYHRSDGLVMVGPTWLVDLKVEKVVAKNAMALGVLEPEAAASKDYFERERQVIGAVANHNFESGVNLGGVMLIHFSKGKEKGKEDQLTGWTVVHDYGDNYRAYFQWVEGGEPSYADFEFDYAQKRLRARNLLAANFMNLGRSFEPTERVGIMPSSYNPDAERDQDRWVGDFRKACAAVENRARCKATDRLLQDRAMIEAVEWLLTFEADSVEEFNACKKPVNDNKPRCAWSSDELEEGVFSIKYLYDLKPSVKGEIAWEIDLKKNLITPRNDLAELAFRAVHPRKGLNL
jgi:hypothetical protein